MMTSALCLALNCNNGDGSIDGTDLLQMSDLLKSTPLREFWTSWMSSNILKLLVNNCL